MILDCIATFIIVARKGGYVAAGLAIGTPRGTLFRRVAKLEKALGVKLLERDNLNGMALTPDGKIFFDRAAKLIDELSTLISETVQITDQSD